MWDICLFFNHLCCISEEYQYLSQVIICVVMIHTLLSCIVMQHSLTYMYVRIFLTVSIEFTQCSYGSFYTYALQNSASSSLSLSIAIYYHNRSNHHHSRYHHFTIFYFLIYFNVSSLYYYYRMDGLLSTWPVSMVNWRLYVLQWNLESTRRLRMIR